MNDEIKITPGAKVRWIHNRPSTGVVLNVTDGLAWVEYPHAEGPSTFGQFALDELEVVDGN